MPNAENASPVSKELFNVQTFGTLGGCVVISGVVASVTCGVFGTDPKIVGLVSSICVAYIALFLAKKRRNADYVIAGLNGFLIYFTLVGATSFYPYLNDKTAADIGDDQTKPSSASVFRPWVRDPNMIHASQKLAEINRKQAAALVEVKSNVAALEGKISVSAIPPLLKAQTVSDLARNRKLIEMTQTNVARTRQIK